VTTGENILHRTSAIVSYVNQWAVFGKHNFISWAHFPFLNAVLSVIHRQMSWNDCGYLSCFYLLAVSITELYSVLC
jgi:hypothetical protein